MACPGWRALYDAPVLGECQAPDGLALPFADVRLEQTGALLDLELMQLCNGFGGLHGPLQWAGVDGSQWSVGQRFRELLSLLPAAIVEHDARQAASQPACLAVVVLSVADQQQYRHKVLDV